MAKDLPSAEDVRLMLAAKDKSADELAAHGDAFVAAGLLHPAMTFYEKAPSPERLDRVKRAAIDAGDFFLLNWVARVRAESVAAADWEWTADKAMAAGKFLFARQAYLKAGLEAKAEEAAKRSAPAPEPRNV